MKLLSALFALLAMSCVWALPGADAAQPLPPSQGRLTRMVEEFARLSAEATGEQRRGLTELRAIGLRAALDDSLRFDGWICMVRDVRQSKDGDFRLDLIVVTLAGETRSVVSISNNALVESAGTEIPAGDPRAGLLHELAPGDAVVVSGTFVEHARDALSDLLGPSVPTDEPIFDAPTFLVHYERIDRLR